MLAEHTNPGRFIESKCWDQYTNLGSRSVSNLGGINSLIDYFFSEIIEVETFLVFSCVVIPPYTYTSRPTSKMCRSTSNNQLTEKNSVGVYCFHLSVLIEQLRSHFKEQGL